MAAWKTGLIFDECYYWEWSLHPQSCYFDHPPLTAWLIAAGHSMLGHTTLAVRAPAILSGILLALAGRALACEMFGSAAGNRAGTLLLLAPVFAGNALLMTPDTFLMPAWACAVLFAWKGFREGSSPVWWLAAGTAAGVGMLSKYTMVLYYGALGVLWLMSRGKRGRLAVCIPLAASVSLLLFLPVLWWNSSHGWVSFGHQINHGFRNEHETLVNFGNLADYGTFLIVLVSPLLGLFCFRSAATRLNDERFRFLAVFFWTVVLFFGFAAAKAHIEANWPIAAFVTGLIMVAGDWDRYGRVWRTAALVILLVADIGAATGVAWLWLPKKCPLAVNNLPFNITLIRGFPGSEKLAASVNRGLGDFQSRLEEFLAPEEVARVVKREFGKFGTDFLCVNTYQFAGVIAFYAPELEPLVCLPDHGRVRFPWINDRAWAGKTALVAEWPHRGPFYFDLFEQLNMGQPVKIPGSMTPLYISLGRNYDPSEVRER